MEYLIDTNVALWSLAAPGQLSKAARKLLEDSNTVVYFSSISVVEFELKRERLQAEYSSLANEFASQLVTQGFSALSFSAQDASGLSGVTPNRDPFDHMLASQALQRNFTLITADRALRKYAPLQTVW